MSSLGITFTGLASGLDSAAIIRALVGLERRPISFLQQQQSSLKSQKSLFGNLRSKLEELQDADGKSWCAAELAANFNAGWY